MIIVKGARKGRLWHVSVRARGQWYKATCTKLDTAIARAMGRALAGQPPISRVVN